MQAKKGGWLIFFEQRSKRKKIYSAQVNNSNNDGSNCGVRKECILAMYGFPLIWLKKLFVVWNKTTIALYQYNWYVKRGQLLWNDVTTANMWDNNNLSILTETRSSDYQPKQKNQKDVSF